MRTHFFKISLAAAALYASHGATHAGPYAPAQGKPGTTAVSKTSPSIVQWATGFQDYVVGTGVDAQWQTPQKALGAALGDSFDIVTLGNSGSVVLTFGGAIFNGAGADFAVFENSFNDTFLELGWVEVSSDGSNFFRFNSYSETPRAVGGFGSVDPTNIDGLAGKYKQGFGTPFDLDQLVGTAGLDVNAVRYVRIKDIVGDSSALDSLGRIIYDPHPTTGSAGFDLDAVGVMNFNAVVAPSVPEPSSWLLALLGGGLMTAARLRHRGSK